MQDGCGWMGKRNGGGATVEGRRRDGAWTENEAAAWRFASERRGGASRGLLAVTRVSRSQGII